MFCFVVFFSGDPARYHAFFIVICIPYSKKMAAMDVVSMGRLGSNVKKTVLICSLDTEKDCVTYTSLQWTGIGWYESNLLFHWILLCYISLVSLLLLYTGYPLIILDLLLCFCNCMGTVVISVTGIFHYRYTKTFSKIKSAVRKLMHGNSDTFSTNYHRQFIGISGKLRWTLQS